MTTNRRQFIGMTAAAVTGATASFWPSRSRAATYTYKFGHEGQTHFPLHVRSSEAFARVAERTTGQLTVNVFPNNRLGTGTDMLSQVRSGALEFMTLSTVVISNLTPVSAISGLGFAFPDYDSVWKTMDGDLGAYVREKIGGVGLVAFEKMWDLGFRQIETNGVAIEQVEQLRGLRLRVPVVELYVSLFEALGTSPVSLNFGELYSALETGIVDGLELPLEYVSTAQLNEVLTHAAITNHMWDGQWFLANARALQSLPEDLRNILIEEVNAAALAQRADVVKINTSLEEELQTQGVTFTRPDISKFKAVLQAAGFYEKWKARFDPVAWELLEKVVGRMA